MGLLPWIMIPVMLVPLWLLMHLAIAVKLRQLGSREAALAPAL